MKRTNTWYAVMVDRNDDDWGAGSADLDEARRMLMDLYRDGHGDAYIAVIDTDGDPICTNELFPDDLDD